PSTSHTGAAASHRNMPTFPLPHSLEPHRVPLLLLLPQPAGGLAHILTVLFKRVRDRGHEPIHVQVKVSMHQYVPHSGGGGQPVGEIFRDHTRTRGDIKRTAEVMRSLPKNSSRHVCVDRTGEVDQLRQHTLNNELRSVITRQSSLSDRPQR